MTEWQRTEPITATKREDHQLAKPALAIQIELEDDQLTEWRENRRKLNAKHKS